MIRKLEVAGRHLTNKQQVKAVIHFLSHSWEGLRHDMAPNENVKTFEDISCHLELEEKRKKNVLKVTSMD